MSGGCNENRAGASKQEPFELDTRAMKATHISQQAALFGVDCLGFRI